MDREELFRLIEAELLLKDIDAELAEELADTLTERLAEEGFLESDDDDEFYL